MSETAIAAKLSGVSVDKRVKTHATPEFLQYRELLFMLTWRDIKIRYKQSVMGFAWAILMPILIVGSGMIVAVAFSTLSKTPINRFDVLSVAVKAVPWAFFVSALRFATGSLLSNKELVTKIYFPREILPFAAVAAGLFDFAVAASVLTLALVLMRVGVSIQLLWVPALLVILVLFCTGLGVLLACANLFFRDVKYLVEVVLTYGIFFTPVFYPASMFGKYGKLLLLNPVGPILESLRDTIILHKAPNLGWLLYSAVWALVTIAAALKVFKRAEPAFAESI